MHSTPAKLLPALAITLLLSGSLLAQQVAQPEISGTAQLATTPASVVTTTGTASTDDEVVQMSVFNVTGQKDDGYTALNTTSGSRVRTPLRDVAASITPFTEDFLNDVGVTSIEDLMTYAPNIEADFEDGDSGFNDTGSRGAGSTDANFRNRGLTMTRVVDYVKTGIPVNVNTGYNIDRIEIASGANSILFGMGSAGGIINFTTKSANAQRNALKLRYSIGTWSGTPVTGIPLQVATLDYNVVLMPKTLGFRLMGIYQDGDARSWRYNQGMRDKRINPALYIKPFKNTIINIKYQTGTRRQSSAFNQTNPGDTITAWLDAGKPIMADYGGTYAVPGTVLGTSGGGNNPNYVFVSGNPNGLAPDLYDFRATYQSTYRYSGADVTNYRLPASFASYYYNTLGPSAKNNMKFDDASITIEQSVGNFNFQLGYYHNNYSGVAHNTQGNATPFRGDPNKYISAVYNVTSTVGFPLMLDPYAGDMYMENTWMTKTNSQQNNVLRLTSEYNFNLKKFGRHRLVNVLEYSKNITRSNGRVEVLVNENQQPFQYAAGVDEGSNSVNWITRRQYVTPGDFSTYYTGDWTVPIQPVYFGGHLWHTTYAANGSNQAKHGETTDYSAMLALQSYWFNNRLATIFGVRLDSTSGKSENTALISDPNDPRILNKTNMLGEYALNGNYSKAKSYRPYTYTAGGVYHVLDWLSLSANYSNNRSAPSATGSRVLPDGTPAPLMQGTTFDYGIRIDFGGKTNTVLTVTRFDTRELHNATINQQESIGNNNLFNIYHALSAAYGGPDQLAAQGVKPIAFDASGMFYNMAMVDSAARGFEASLTGKITENLKIRAAFSYTQKEKTDIAPEVTAYFDSNIPTWIKLANAYDQSAQSATAVNFTNFNAKSVSIGTSGATNTISLLNYIRAQLYMPGDNTATGTGPLNGQPYNDANNATSVKQGLIGQYMAQEGALGSRPYKFNLTVTYDFDKTTFLKGFTVSGGVRYQSAAIMPTPQAGKGDTNWAPPPLDCGNLDLNYSDYNGARGMMNGESLLFWDAMVSYRCKLFGGRTTMRLQLNVKNIFNQCVVTVGRTSLDDVWSKVYLNPPRLFQLTATFDF